MAIDGVTSRWDSEYQGGHVAPRTQSNLHVTASPVAQRSFYLQSKIGKHPCAKVFVIAGEYDLVEPRLFVPAKSWNQEVFTSHFAPEDVFPHGKDFGEFEVPKVRSTNFMHSAHSQLFMFRLI